MVLLCGGIVASILVHSHTHTHTHTQENKALTTHKKAKWTVMVYMSGDNDLEEYVVKDIEKEMASVGSSEEVQIVALADRGPGYDASRGDWQSTKLFHITKDMTADSQSAVSDWGERNMGDKQTLIEFVSWAKSHYPADHYALYFWGHGWSWHPGYVMEDDTDMDALDLDELKQSLPSIGFIDMVGYDGCNMSSVEVDSVWSGYATAISSSQEYVDWSGVDYGAVLTSLSSDPSMPAEKLAVISAQSASDEKTWSAVAVDNRLENIVSSINEWSDALIEGLPKYHKQYSQAFASTHQFIDAISDRDLYGLVSNIDKFVKDDKINIKGKALISALDSAILFERHARDISGVNGISITLYDHSNVDKEELDYYEKLGIYGNRGWVDFIKAYSKYN